MPLQKIASNPKHSIEHYKFLIGQIRQLSLLADPEKFNALANQEDQLTDTDKKMWRLINRQEAPPADA